MIISGFPKVDSTIPDLGSPKVDPVTGTLTLRVMDYGLRDLGETFFLVRAYTTKQMKDNKTDRHSLGLRWMLDFDGKLTRKGANLRLPIGAFRWEAFCFQDGHWLHTKTEKRYHLQEKREGFVLRDFWTSAEYVYDARGHLSSIQKKGGLQRKIHYYGDFPTGITLSCGKKISLEYEDGRLIYLDDYTRDLFYKYENGLLRRVIYPNQTGIQYDYDDRMRLISCTDRNGVKRFLLSYDAYGRVERLSMSTGEEYVYRYADQDRKTIVLNESTMASRTYYWNYRNQVERIRYEDGGEEQLGYDEEGRVVYRQDRSGKIVRHTYDERGLLAREECSDGLITDYSYDDLGRPVRKHDSLDGEEQYTWNKNGWLVKKKTRLTEHAWRQEQWERDMVGRVTAYSKNGNRIRYAYEGNAPLPHLMEMPCGGKFRYRYDVAYRTLLIQSDHGELLFGYNVLDLVARIADALGNHRVYLYDLQGESLDGKQAPEFDFPGSREERRNLLSVNEAYEGKADLLCDYDAKGRLTEVRYRSDGQLAARFLYDIGGRLTEERTDGGEKDGDGKSLWLKRWKYDVNDNIVEERKWLDPQDETSTRGRIYILRHEYDAQNRLLVSEDNMGERREYEYDSLNCCIMFRLRRKDRPAEITKYLYNATGRLIGRDEKSDYQRTGKLWAHTEFVLDAEGNCRSVVFPDGTERTGEEAEKAYRTCLAGLPRYEDDSGYCGV